MGDLGKVLCLSYTHFLSYKIGMTIVPLHGSKTHGWHVFGLVSFAFIHTIIIFYIDVSLEGVDAMFSRHFLHWCVCSVDLSTLSCSLLPLYHLQNKKFPTIVLGTLTPVLFFKTGSFSRLIPLGSRHQYGIRNEISWLWKVIGARE